MNFERDIPLSLAIAAHSGTSFVPERRGATEVASYSAELANVYSTLKREAEVGGTLDLLDAEFNRFRSNYRGLYLKNLVAKSRRLSTMITGASNYPVARQEKRWNTAHRHLENLLEFKARAIRAMIRTLRPDLRPIMAGDSDAIERLELEISKAERVQERMKAANAAIRKNWKAGTTAVLAALVDLEFTEPMARKLIEKDCMGGIGFPSYALTNNNANIRRMKQRLAAIKIAKETPDSLVEGDNGISVEDCPAENRVRIRFPGKPAAEIRKRLKSNGFRWAPSLGVWQGYRNYRTLEIAKSFVPEPALALEPEPALVQIAEPAVEQAA